MSAIDRKFDESWLSMLGNLLAEARMLEVQSQLALAEEEYVRVQISILKLESEIQSIDCSKDEFEELESLLATAKSFDIDLTGVLTGCDPTKISDLPQQEKNTVAAQALLNIVAMNAQYILEREKNVLAKIHLDESFLPNEIEHRLDEVLIRFSGEQWVIHKYDPDPEPSRPHAHNYAESLVLDLRNGDLWRKTKLQKHPMNPKNLEKLRQRFIEKGVLMPELDYSTSKGRLVD